MRIAYEGGVFEIMRHGGAARYFLDLINHLPPSVQPVVMPPEGLDLPLSQPATEIESVRIKPPLKMVRRYWRPAQHTRLAQQVASTKPDLVHWTYYVGLCRRPIKRGPLPNVVTVLDFIHEAFPELDPEGENRRWQRQAIEAADHICCISETTYAELCQRYPQAAKRASVTLLGNTFGSVIAEPAPKAVTERPYVLFVGRRSGYKNFRVVWDAWKQARMSCPDLDLVIAGPPMKRRERANLGMLHQPDGFIHLGAVSDSQLKGLYQSAAAFVFPTQMEGFGLPALEAMECETPVLASTCEALQEVLGPAGHYFDPHRVNRLTELFIAVGRQSLPDRETKLDIGRKRAQEFSWQRTASQTAQAYRQVLANQTHHLSRRLAA
ncbi:MAG: glycosyltransferase family 4 protein [Rubripirellula sp.]